MISVVIPTYNRGNVIERAIRSVLNQSIDDLEIIIVDDNSNDNTEDIVKNINDKRIRYFKLKENRGACFARNYGVSLAEGEYIAFQDSDDCWRVNKLEKQLEVLNNNFDIVSCQIKTNNNEIFPEETSIEKDAIYWENKLSTQTILGKKKCFQEEKFDESLPRFQDWDLAIRLIKKYKVNIIDEILVDVFVQENSISKNNSKAIKAMNIFISKHGINNRIKSNYLRVKGLYEMQDGVAYKISMRKAFIEYPLSLKNIFNVVMITLGLNKLHYKFYYSKGYFKY